MALRISNGDFGTGDFTGWIQQNSSETAIVTTPAFNGASETLSLSDSNADTGGAIYQPFSGSYGNGTTLYARCYFQMHNNGGTNYDFGIIVLGNNYPTMSGVDARVNLSGSDLVINLYNRTTSSRSSNGTYAIQFDTWYRLELGTTISDPGSTTGSASCRLYNAVNNTLLDSLSWTGIDSSAGSGNAYGAIGLGSQGGVGSGNRTYQLYINDVGISDSGWVGPAPTVCSRCGQPVPSIPAPGVFDLTDPYWSQFANTGEIILCSKDMYTTPLYVTYFGATKYDSSFHILDDKQSH